MSQHEVTQILEINEKKKLYMPCKGPHLFTKLGEDVCCDERSLNRSYPRRKCTSSGWPIETLYALTRLTFSLTGINFSRMKEAG